MGNSVDNPTQLDWLLEPADPSVRYLTLCHLLGRTDDDPDVVAARTAIPRSKIVERIFSRQAPEGHWGDPKTPYLPKYKATYWTLMSLGYLGMTREDERVRRAAEHIFGFQGPMGGFLTSGADEAKREYDRKVQKARDRGKKPPAESGFIADFIHQAHLSCLTGNVVAALLRLGYEDDPRLWRAVDWLVEIQNADGGWLCPYWKAHIRDTHGCFYGTICALEAFAVMPEKLRTPAIQEAVAHGAEFLLMHRLYRADHHDFQVINPKWLTLAFPWFYCYDILRGLWVLTRLGYQDERMRDAVGIICEKQTPDGRWILESTPYGRMQSNLEKKGQPSKWVTLHALSVMGAMNNVP